MYFLAPQAINKLQVKSPLKRLVNTCALSFSAVTLLMVNPAIAQKISGKIINEQGEPVSNALIELARTAKKVRSDDNGNFTFEQLNEGIFELHASAKNYGHINRHIEVKKDDLTGINVVLSASVMEIIDVHATPLHSSSIESALPVNVISADELKLKQASTLGETLKNEVGVHSSYYGPVASTPIIRGLDGPRVLITQNGLDVGDASRVGPDHVVATETSTATQIEVLRGPATLFYGSGAIGGVVNVVDERVPTSSAQQFDYLLQYNDVSNEQQASFNLQTGTEKFAFHLDGFWRDANDYKIAGKADEHEDHEGHHEGDHDDHTEEEHEAEPNDRLANSSSKATGGTIGASYLFDQGFLGFSYGRMDREYGIPGHSHAEEDHEDHDGDTHEDHAEEGVSAKMKQDRFQMLSEYNISQGFINKVISKLAYSDYQHQEIEAGEVGTIFTNKSVEARADIYHNSVNEWKGAWTLHYKGSDFKAQGEEAFSPPSTSQMFAAAWLEEKHFGDFLVQLGARVERVILEADDSEVSGEFSHHEGSHDDDHHEETDHEEHGKIVSFDKQSFTPLSASIGVVWDYKPGYNLGFSTAISQRAPSSSELFSFGPHIGTNTFEVGAMFELHEEDGEIHVELSEVEPSVETSLSLDLTWRKFSGNFGYVVSAFYNQIDDYYYQQDTGLTFNDDHGHDEHNEIGEPHEEEEGLPVLIYQQDDVTMYGLEAEFVYQLSSSIKTSLFGDYIRAKLANPTESENSSLPRIPPLRIGALVNYQVSNIDSELSVSHYFDQDKVSALESKTDGYTMVDANINYYVDGMGNDLVLYFKAQNLIDEHARVHSSFLKEIAPLPARNFSVGIRGSF